MTTSCRHKANPLSSRGIMGQSGGVDGKDRRLERSFQSCGRTRVARGTKVHRRGGLFRKKGFQLLAGVCMLTAALPTGAWAKKHPEAPPAPTISPDEQAAQSIYAAAPDGVAAFYAYRHNAPFWLSRA